MGYLSQFGLGSRVDKLHTDEARRYGHLTRKSLAGLGRVRVRELRVGVRVRVRVRVRVTDMEEGSVWHYHYIVHVSVPKAKEIGDSPPHTDAGSEALLGDMDLGARVVLQEVVFKRIGVQALDDTFNGALLPRPLI